MENTLQIVENNGIQTVSARELYKGLEITDRFNRWFESLLKYGFEENQDFRCVKTSTQQNQYGGIKEIDDYSITLDMAKQICMLQRTELGKKYRTYLINLEKAWNEPGAVMARALEIAHKTLADCQNQVAIMKPKADVYDQLVDRSKCINFRDFASKIGLSQNEFMEKLRSKYIYKNSIGEYRAYSEYQKYFCLRTYTKGDKTGEQLMLNMNGITYFTEKYKPSAIAELVIKQNETEYQKIIDETAEAYIEKEKIPVVTCYSLDRVAYFCKETPETIKNFCVMEKYIDENGKPTLYGLEVKKYFLANGYMTEAGKDHIVSVFYSINEAEKGMKSSNLGKAE